MLLMTLLTIGLALGLLAALNFAGTGYGVRDAALKVTKALPNGAANVTSDAIDLGKTSAGDFVANVEFLLSAPALTTAQQPDAKTMIYDVLVSDNADMSVPTTLIAGAITQTGAGGAGAAAATYKFKLPTNTKRYLAIKATGSAVGDSSAKSLTLELLA